MEVISSHFSFYIHSFLPASSFLSLSFQNVSGGAVCWRSKRQTLTVGSTAEAECVALAAANQKAVWIGRLFNFALKHFYNVVVPINVRNQAAIKLAKDDSSAFRTKRIDIKFHIVRDHLLQENITVKFCPTYDMTADLLTKALGRVLFHRLREVFELLHSKEPNKHLSERGC